MKDHTKNEPSLLLNTACFVGTFLLSLCLGFAMFILWFAILVAALIINKSQKATKRVKSASSSALFCVMFFLIALALWPVFRIVAPKYFDEGWDEKTGQVIRHELPDGVVPMK